MGNRLVVLFVFAVVASLLLFSGCKGGTTEEIDLTTPPPLPEESGAEGGEQPPAPPAEGSEDSSGQALPSLPLLG